jgi:hypothetical protein
MGSVPDITDPDVVSDNLKLLGEPEEAIREITPYFGVFL